MQHGLLGEGEEGLQARAKTSQVETMAVVTEAFDLRESAVGQRDNQSWLAKAA